MKVAIIGASGKLGRYMVQHARDPGYEVVGGGRAKSVGKLDAFKGRITVVLGPTNDREVIWHAVAGCDGVLTVLVPERRPRPRGPGNCRLPDRLGPRTPRRPGGALSRRHAPCVGTTVR